MIFELFEVVYNILVWALVSVYTIEATDDLNLIFDKVSKAVVFSNIADHNGIACALNLSCKKPKKKVIVKYNINQMTRESWLNMKSRFDNFQNTNTFSVDEHCSALTNHIISGIDKYVPKIDSSVQQIDGEIVVEEVKKSSF